MTEISFGKHRVL